MSDSPNIITIMTDFGLEDPYVGMMKGVMLGRAPHVNFVTLTNSIPPQDVRQAAIFLRYASPYFPQGTVHLAVVDPGVGTPRAVLAAEADGQFFVAPDNGLLDPVLRHAKKAVAVKVDRPDLYLDNVSSTFHGRDIMSPVAAAISTGLKVEELGRVVTDWVPIEIPVAVAEQGKVAGELLYADRFGNLVTSIRLADIVSAGIRNDDCEIRLGGRFLAGIKDNYSEVWQGQACAIFNSAGQLEIAVRGGSAAEVMNLHSGVRITVTNR